MNKALERDTEIRRRISRHLKRMLRLRRPGGRSSVDSAVKWIMRDAFVRDQNLTPDRLRALVVEQAGFDGYHLIVACDRRWRHLDGVEEKSWITDPDGVSHRPDAQTEEPPEDLLRERAAMAIRAVMQCAPPGYGVSTSGIVGKILRDDALAHAYLSLPSTATVQRIVLDVAKSIGFSAVERSGEMFLLGAGE